MANDLTDVVEVIPHYLYKITNLVNGKVYIGVTKHLKHRSNCHLHFKGDRPVNKAVNKYGKENFTFEVLCEGGEDYIYDLEVKAIQLYNSLTTGHGYNLSVGGKGGHGGKRMPVLHRSDDSPKYVSGFWFPNKRTALSALNWKAGLFSSRQKTGSLGEVCFVQTKRGPQKCMFVSGFWFPNKKQAVFSLMWSSAKYDRRKKKGVLGDIVVNSTERSSPVSDNPCYFRGFWFPSLQYASSVYCVGAERIRLKIRQGFFEENSKTPSDLQAVRYTNQFK